MELRSIGIAVVVTTLVATAALAGLTPAIEPTDGSVTATPTGGPATVTATPPVSQGDSDQLRSRLREEQASLDTLLDTMTEEELLYARLLDAHRQRAVLRGRMQEHGSIESVAFANLTRFLRRTQDDPERLDELEYEIRRSAETLAALEASIEEERAIVDRLRELVDGENETIAAVSTPVDTPLSTQRESQLSGLALLNESLVAQEDAIVEARTQQRKRAEYVGFYQEIWRDIDTQTRKQVLDQISDELTETLLATAVRDSRFENQRLLAVILRDHHRARVATVDRFRAQIATLTDSLSRFEADPTSAVRDRLLAQFAAQRSDIAGFRALLANESDVARRLREALTTHVELQETRLAVLTEQTRLLTRLKADQTKARQNETLAAMEDSFERERSVLSAIERQIREEQRVVTALYGVFTDVPLDDRSRAYLRVRDGIADLLASNLERLERRLDEEQDDIDEKTASIARIEDTWALQARRQRIPLLANKTVQEHLEAAVLRDRVADIRTVAGWLTALRTEADQTFAAEAALLDLVAATVRTSPEPVTPTAETATTPTPTLSESDPPTGGGVPVALLAALAVISTALLLAWRRDPDRARTLTVTRLRRFLEPTDTDRDSETTETAHADEEGDEAE